MNDDSLYRVISLRACIGIMTMEMVEPEIMRWLNRPSVVLAELTHQSSTSSQQHLQPVTSMPTACLLTPMDTNTTEFYTCDYLWTINEAYSN